VETINLLRDAGVLVRYSYKDVHRDENEFENQLIANLAEFIQRAVDQFR
jgi:hypothetical protein